MTVSELIEELRKYPPDMRVFTEMVGFGPDNYSEVEIRQGKYKEDEAVFLGYDSY